jgi:hypothetical protein
MHRPESFAAQSFIASLAFIACATLANAAPVNHDREPAAASQPAPTLAVEQVRVPLLGLRDEAAMVLVGAALIGLAAAVRRAA